MRTLPTQERITFRCRSLLTRGSRRRLPDCTSCSFQDEAPRLLHRSPRKTLPPSVSLFAVGIPTTPSHHSRSIKLRFNIANPRGLVKSKIPILLKKHCDRIGPTRRFCAHPPAAAALGNAQGRGAQHAPLREFCPWQNRLRRPRVRAANSPERPFSSANLLRISRPLTADERRTRHRRAQMRLPDHLLAQANGNRHTL